MTNTTETNRCPYCLADMEPDGDDPVIHCASCRTPHHQACFAEHGRCTVFGCGSPETSAPGDTAPPRPGSLHPFLPFGEQVLNRTASFLSVVHDRDRRKRRGEEEMLSLEAPRIAVCGRPLEMTLTAFTPRVVKGEGVRLVVRSLLRQGGQTYPLTSQEAVIVGRARKGWRTRFKLWAREEPEILLRGGTHEFRLAFDPAPLRWRGPLPKGDSIGATQYLVLHAEVDASRGAGGKTKTQRLGLLDGRRPPPATEGEPLDLSQPAEPVPLGSEDPGFWRARPVIPESVWTRMWPASMVALLHESHDQGADPPPVDTLDLTLQPLEANSPVLRGSLTLVLHRRRFSGRLELDFITERRSPRDTAWKTYVRETAILFEGSAPKADVSGEHEMAWEYVMPPAFQAGKKHDRRRVRVRATLQGEGRPLHSLEREVKVIPPKRKGKRPRRPARE